MATDLDSFMKDVVQRHLEACAAISGAGQEQPTWFGRSTRSVSTPTNKEFVDLECMEETQLRSIQALSLLATTAADLLDVVFTSDEKDKVVPIVSSILQHVSRFVHNHSSSNFFAFAATSQFLAAISSYQYTRRAWRKEVLDLLLDVNFFKMNMECSVYWRQIVDNLMTHDRVTFKDLLSRVVVSSVGVNLFMTRDQELEHKANMLKRLAFSIFCSEEDQYQQFMPEVQECLVDCLKLYQSFSLQNQVLLCFRVLLLRMSAQHLTSLWPTIITELVQILQQLENEMQMQLKEVNGNSGNSGWRTLILSACKLLEVVITVDAVELPQFQLYRWAFVGENGIAGENTVTSPSFTPYVGRICSLMSQKYGIGSDQNDAEPPLLRMSHIDSLSELQLFFYRLIKDFGVWANSSYTPSNKRSTASSNRQNVESILQADFLEPFIATR